MDNSTARQQEKCTRVPATKRFMNFLEKNAMKIRKELELKERERLDPYKYQKKLGIKIRKVEDAGLTREQFEGLQQLGPKGWSGCTMSYPNGRVVVVIHPDQTPQRAYATIMEEACHVYYKHPPYPIELINGIYARVYNPQVEQEAFWTGAAALLPASVVADAVWRKTPLINLSDEYGVSHELIEMRIKTLSLWEQHKTNIGNI